MIAITSTDTQQPASELPAGANGAGRELRVRIAEHRYASAAGAVQALGEVDLTIGAGELVCVVGSSGCGKSTLLELIAGLRMPTAGTITLDGRTIIGPSRLRGVVFQQAASLYPWLSVAGNVELGLKFQRVPRDARRARVQAELERVGIAEFADHRVYELSGGMQQRCQIARALAADPEILLLDEPFSALDALTRETLQGELRDIWLATGRSIVFVTHSIEEAALLGSRVVVMSARPGRVVLDRPLGFSRSGRSNHDLRSDVSFVDACRDLRAAVGQVTEERT